jgi:hypothetical protein
MNKQELIERELERLPRIVKDYTQKVETVLSSISKEKVKLWLSKQDEYRLLTLRTWELKYKVDLTNILQILLPFWNTLVKTRSRKVLKGLGIRVTTLTGKKSEQVLKEKLLLQYPHQENKLLYMNHNRERIIQKYLKQLEKRSDDGIRSHSDPSRMYTEDGRPKTLTDFSTPEAFVRYYRKLIKKESLAREEVEQELKRYPYRGNPFLQELL